MSIPPFLFFLLILFAFQPCSSSLSQPILLSLTHSLSAATSYNNTIHHLLRSTSSRSAARFRRHFRNNKSSVSSPVSLPLSPGSDYTLSLTLPTVPPQTVSLFMDTGSDLVWFPCSPFSCILCEGKQSSNPMNITSSASRIPCGSAKCSAAHSYSSSSDLCAVARCPLESIEMSECSSYHCPQFYYAYGDGSFVATLYDHPIAIDVTSAAAPLVISNFTFGCAHSALAEPVGVAGFGRGVLSLPAQLAMMSPQLGNSFSYCLVSHSFNSDRVRSPSPLILGRYVYDSESKTTPGETLDGGFSYTKMLNNPKHPYFYCVGLEGISVGGTKIPATTTLTRVDADGNGGMVVDSGTTYTMLPSSLFKPLVFEFERKLGKLHKRASDVEANTGLSPCYYFDNRNPADVPSLVLHFKGNNESGVELPRGNYFYEFVDGSKGKKARRVGCLMLMDGGDEAEMGGGPAGILGNYQQQGFEVVYDLEKRRVGFARRHCSSLWDGLVRR